MSDPAILFVKPKAISAKDKKTLQQAGILVIEVDDVNNVKFTRAFAEIGHTQMLLAASEAIPTSEIATKAFGAAVCAAIQAKRKST